MLVRVAQGSAMVASTSGIASRCKGSTNTMVV